MAVQEFDFGSGKVLDPKRKQAILALQSDDDAEVVSGVLRKLSYRLQGRETDLRNVLEHVRNHKIGVLFLDTDLPGIKVSELLPSLKKAFPEFHPVVVSSAVTKELLEEALCLGAVGFLVKPVRADALEKVLAKIK